MTKFTDELFDDLIREHGSTLALTRPPAAPRRHTATTRKLLATGAGGVAVAAAAAGVLVAGSGTPAYAVTAHPDGTVTLAISQASGIAGANARLRQLGDRVVVVPVEPGCPGINSLPAPAVTPEHRISMQTERNRDSGTLTVNAQGVPAGDIIVVGAQTTAHGTIVAGKLTSPPAPSCISLPSPPPGNAGSGSGAGGGTGGGSGSSESGSG